MSSRVRQYLINRISARKCPRCGHADLQRVPGRRYHHFYRKVGLALRHYACRNCHWRGSRWRLPA